MDSTNTHALAKTPNADPIDRLLLADMLGGDELVETIIQAFLASLQRSLLLLAQAIARADLPALAKAAHSLAGSAHMTAAVSIGAAAKALELTCRQGGAPHELQARLVGLQAALTDFSRTYAAVIPPQALTWPHAADGA